MKETKLNQLIAVEKGIKSRTHAQISELYKIVQKAELFSGVARKYTPKNDDGETCPDENKQVQYNADDVIKLFNSNIAEYLSVRSKIDMANTIAKADIVVDNQILVQDVPVTHLLVLEKTLGEYMTFIKAVPVLSSDDSWSRDDSNNLFKTFEIITSKTKKIQKPLVMYPATTEHPAQTMLITEDETVGNWRTVKISGALSSVAKEMIIEKVEKLLIAIKFAREEANSINVSGLCSLEKEIIAYLSL